MKIRLIQGQYTGKDAIKIITRMIDVKIKFQEEKIKHSENEEDIKIRETHIRKLQKDLYESLKHIESHGDRVSMESEINLY